MRSFASFRVLLISLGLFLSHCVAFPQNEIEALLSFKRAIMEDPLLVFSNWNSLDSHPCGWSGISCSIAGDHVIKLNISGASLSGFIAPELYRLSFLQELILHGNSLIGMIPKEIGMLKSLKVLDLGANRLTGMIPLEMHSSNESPLRDCGSSQLKVVDFSYNFLVGSIPKCLDYLPRSSFTGNCLQEKDPKQRPSAQCDGASPPIKAHQGVNTTNRSAEGESTHQAKSSKPVWLLALEIITGITVGLLFVVAIFTAFQKCKSKPIPWKKSSSMKDNITIYIDSEILKDVVRYSREELEAACEDFSNIIESSPESVVYKGTTKDGQEIAVVSVCIKEEQWNGHLELYFQKEVADLARLNHENAGKLLGYCRESNPHTRMLVFEYASNGTLHEHLHFADEEGCQFSWIRRMKIIIGIAKGLKYLHTEVDPPFTISELNSTSIYLTEDFSPKLVDFECWKMVLSRSEKSSGTISNMGAVCILPNSLERRHLDIQGNIYSFGILLLEMISGRPTYSKEKGFLVDWANKFLELPDVISYAVDPELKHFRYEDLRTICEVVNLCIHSNSSTRTSMQNLCSILENGIDTSISADLKASSLAWAELALSS